MYDLGVVGGQGLYPLNSDEDVVIVCIDQAVAVAVEVVSVVGGWGGVVGCGRVVNV